MVDADGDLNSIDNSGDSAQITAGNGNDKIKMQVQAMVINLYNVNLVDVLSADISISGSQIQSVL